jgi:hypothetical protein
MTVRGYLLSLPERFIRSAVGVGAGVIREVGDLALPAGVRSTQLYRNLVDTTLRYLIEQVGGVEGVYSADDSVEASFIARRTAGNAIEALGIVAFRASPVWVLAALADVCGAGRQMIPEITDALKREGLLEQDAEFHTVDELLDGLERTSSRLASTINAPPLDVAGLRAEWDAIRNEARSLQPARLPTRESVTGVWRQLAEESQRQNRAVFETSSVLALSAVAGVPERVRWLSASTRVGATRAGQVVGAALLDHYRQTLGEIREAGYAAYAARQLRPYVRAAVGQFSPRRATLTERLMEKVAQRRRNRRDGAPADDHRRE